VKKISGVYTGTVLVLSRKNHDQVDVKNKMAVNNLYLTLSFLDLYAILIFLP